MSFWREQGVSPMLGCLPMLLQMPIWIALWSALQSTFELRHAPFLWGHMWIDYLSPPDRMINFGRLIKIPLLSVAIGPIDGLNLLPFLLWSREVFGFGEQTRVLQSLSYAFDFGAPASS